MGISFSAEEEQGPFFGSTGYKTNKVSIATQRRGETVTGPFAAFISFSSDWAVLSMPGK